MELIVGIDTSAYTTSVAVIDSEQKVWFDERQLLKVPAGLRGLRQSEAVFQHVQNLPDLVERMSRQVDPRQIVRVVASGRPRPVADSYMPVFTVGAGLARSLAAALKVTPIMVSHQEGHLAAGIWSAQGPREEKFLAVHLSGGTSELLVVGRASSQDQVFAIDRLGQSNDLHAGQFVDRLGVRLGLSFPAGAALEKLAAQAEGEPLVRLPSAVRGYDFSFAGPAAAAERLLDRGVPGPLVARAVEACLVKTLEKVLRRAREQLGLTAAILVGGVAANHYLRQRLTERLSHPAVGMKLYFTDPRYSTDNAVGVALCGTYIKY
ncbi:MAG: O-sialoglycoprotein endopeptidase [Firmicutes bacterium]|nr:O-sialoglycoprotein endopeptidase [Bacillota bacterium]